MNYEFFFRACLALLSLALLTIRLYYGRRARQAQRRVVAERVGVVPTALLYISGGSAALAAVAYVLVPQVIQWAVLPLPFAMRWLGIALGILVIALFSWTHRALGENWAMPGVIQDKQTLVRVGPYQWVRHPMYATIFVWALAYFLISANWLIGALWLALAVTAAALTGVEEQTLIEAFGDEYRAYMQRTGRFIPRLGL